MPNSRIEYQLVSALEDCVKVMEDQAGTPQWKWLMAVAKAKSTLGLYRRGEHPCKGSYLKIGKES